MRPFFEVKNILLQMKRELARRDKILIGGFVSGSKFNFFMFFACDRIQLDCYEFCEVLCRSNMVKCFFNPMFLLYLVYFPETVSFLHF